MTRKYFTEEEITLCTYAAIYDAEDFGGTIAICSLTNRSISSIHMKIRNIIAILDAKGVARNTTVVGLTGVATGLAARETNWELVEPLTRLSRQDFLRRCRDVLHS